MQTAKPKGYTLSLTLADGTTQSWTVKGRRPRHIASWMMQRMPYGTSFQGMTYDCKPLAS